MFAGDSAVDPITGQSIGLMDSHYSVVSLYYRLLNQFQPAFVAARDNYLNRVWHDYAVLLLQTAEALNITTRPPGFKQAPPVPLAYTVHLSPTYQLSTPQVEVCTMPPDPDPATQAIQPVPGSASEYKIVTITVAGRGSGGAIVGGNTVVVNQDSVLAFLKAMSPTDLNNFLAKVFA